MKNVKDTADMLAPFFRDNGFFRKGNAFFKIENCFMFWIHFYKGYSLIPEFQVIPLYYPYDMETIPFGGRFSDYKSGWIKFEDYYQEDERAISYRVKNNYRSMDFDKWINSVEDFCVKYIFPLMLQVSSLQKMREFLNKGFYSVRGEWSNLTKVAYYELKAYTHFVLEEYDEMNESIKNGIHAIDEFNPCEKIKSKWKSVFDILNEKKELPDDDKKKWLNEIVSCSCNVWLGKNSEKLIKNTGDGSMCSI